MVKKILFLLTILLFILIPTNTFAQTYNINFNSFIDTAETLTSNIQCNNSQCIVYNVPFYNYSMDFEWGTSNSPTCSSTSIVSGSLYADNTNFGINNNDFSWTRVYIVPTGNSNTKVPCSFQVSENGTSFVCTSTSLSSNFKIGFSFNNTFGSQTSFNSVISRSIDINCDTSTGQIIDNQNANTQNIINNDTQNSQNIINNQNQNTQNIINNQNQNTQQQIESQKVCNIIDNNKCDLNNKYLDSSGTEKDGSNSCITKYTKINKNTLVKVLIPRPQSGGYLCYYNVNKVKISCQAISSLTENQILTLPQNVSYMRYSINISNNQPQLEICESGNQALDDSINSLNDTLNSEETPNTNQDISDMEDMVASDTPISDLITMPLTLINAYINGVNSSCSSVNLGNLYGTNLILPCINLEQRLGSNLWNKIDVLFSIFMCYNIGMLFITAFDGLTSLRDDFEGLYQPRHADTGYKPKHGG